MTETVTPGRALYESLQRSASAETGIPVDLYATWDQVSDATQSRMGGIARDVIAAYIEASGDEPRTAAVDWTGTDERAKVSRGISLGVTRAFRAGVREGVRRALPTSSPHHTAEITPEPAEVRNEAGEITARALALITERDRLRELLNEARIAEPHPDQLLACAEDAEADELAAEDDAELAAEAEFMADAATLDTDFTEDK